MAWLRVDDRFRTHPKVQRAGLAGWLAFCGISYCREHLTDGVIPREAVKSLAPGLPTPMKHAAKLVAVGLWHEHVDGFRVHDFGDWNPSKEDVMSSRDKEREKKRTQRGQTGDSRERASGGAGDGGSGSLSGSDLGSGLPEELPEESLRETPEALSVIPPQWGRRGNGSAHRADTLVGDHRRCLPCAADACNRGLCVPGFLAQQWLQQLGRQPDAESQVREFVGRVLSRISGVVGDDPLKFWRSEWAAEHGTQARASGQQSRGAQNVDAARRAVEKMARKAALDS